MTYVFCLVHSSKPPRMARVPRALPGMGAPRLLPIARSLYAVVADAPDGKYGEAAINRNLSNIDWVSRAAVAHEAVIEHFVDATAVLPMKLFTIFTGDDRAVDYFSAERSRLITTAKRVANQQEWGVRVQFDRSRAAAPRPRAKASASGSGLAYLSRKKATRDAAVELAANAVDTVTRTFDRLAAKARDARRRSASELPAQGSLLLDAAFLVPKARAAAFRKLVERESRSLADDGYVVTATGPWPPYSFVQES